MMSGKFKEYNWKDIQQLIYKDSGLISEEDQRTRGQIWYKGQFTEPEHILDTCVELMIYDKPYSERIQEHSGNK